MELKKEIPLEPLDQASQHILFHHEDSDGFIALAKKMPGGGFKQYHYKPKELAEKLSDWLGEDVYFSQNTFYKPKRQIENIRELRALYIDIDCYNIGQDPSWVAGKIEAELFQEEIPVPSLIIYSGRGLVPVWLIEPVPYKALPLWQAIQNYLFSKLAYVGADKKALDASRIFRISGSVNSKVNKPVQVEYISNYRYALREIQHDYLPEIPIRKEVKKKKGRKKKIHHLFNVYSLHHARLLDLVKIVELRSHDMRGHREMVLFLYRYWTCCFVNDPKEALASTLELNNQFKEPLKENVVIGATKSAEKAWEAKSSKEANEIAISKGYPGAGYNLKNATIIEWLKVTEEEQQQLVTIIGRKEKNNRFKEYRRKRRGSVSREEYLKTQQEHVEDKLSQLEKAIKNHPNATHQELAKMFEVSTKTIQRWKRKL